MWQIIACFAAAAVLFFLFVIIWDTHRFVKRFYRLESPKIKKTVRLAVLADLHNKEYGKNNEKLLEAIRRENPDMILIAGDMIVSVEGKSTEPAERTLEALSREYPVYFGIGNHEYRIFHQPEVYGDMGERFRKFLKKSGIILLENKYTDLAEYGIRIYGLDLPRSYYKKFRKTELETETLESMLGKPPKDRFSILLAHNPDYFESYVRWGADLSLSGHVHGGVMRLPFLGGVLSTSFTLFPKYDGGIFRKGDASAIVSRGLGAHTIPIRVFNPGELIIVDLVQK